MATSILHRLFGWGGIPVRERATLEREGIVLSEEGVGGSITFRNFRAPGKRYSWRKSGYVGSVVLTQQRLVGFGFSKPLVNVPLDDPHLAKLEIAAEGDAVLCIAFDAADFDAQQSGRIECRWRTPQARLFADRLTRAGACCQD